MNITELLSDKALKPKEKTEILSRWLLESRLGVDMLLDFAESAKDPLKATCIEALEYATKQKPALAHKRCFDFVVQSLTAKAPRVKWESARVIGNVASLFADHLDTAIAHLLVNAEHEGTVVRWSAAYALGEIVKLHTETNKELLPAIQAVCEQEEKGSIKKIYLDAIKKSAK